MGEIAVLEGWKYAVMACMGLSVMQLGLYKILVWCAINLDSQMKVNQSIVHVASRTVNVLKSSLY